MQVLGKNYSFYLHSYRTHWSHVDRFFCLKPFNPLDRSDVSGFVLVSRYIKSIWKFVPIIRQRFPTFSDVL